MVQGRKYAPLVRNGEGKRAGPVEDVLAWAWREELPKRLNAGGPAAIPTSWRIDAPIDYTGSINEYGCVVDLSSDSLPHPDAIIIGDAVKALDGMVLEMPEDWQPAPELDRFGYLGPEAVSNAWRRMTREEGGRLVLRLKPSDLVIRRAISGWSGEGMDLDDVTMETERDPSNGKTRWFVRETQHQPTGLIGVDGIEQMKPVLVELSGIDRRGYRKPGAYCKHYLDPDPVAAIIARAEYEIWLSCLDLVIDACGILRDVAMLPSRVPLSPWLTRAPVHAREIDDLVASQRIEDARRASLQRRYPRWFRLFENNLPAPA